MEKYLKIKTSDGKSIYGTLNTGKAGMRKPSSPNSLIIFVHGFTGHMNEHFLYNSAHFFPERGFDTFRFNLYSFENDSRKLIDCTISDHINDLNTVIDYFIKKYKKIYAIGHSLGGLVVIHSRHPALKALVLWEPSQEAKDMCKGFKYVKEIDSYVDSSNVDIVVGKNFVNNANTLSPIKDVLQTLTIPIKIIGAELEGAKIAKNLYFANANSPKELCVIKGSGHTFDEGDSEEELFAETLNFLREL